MINRQVQHQKVVVFGKRLKEARKAAGIPQDRLGVMIGLDELTASARISRYETGVHQPSVQTALLIAHQLSVPLAYLYCDDDRIARVLLRLKNLNEQDMSCLESWLEEKLDVIGAR